MRKRCGGDVRRRQVLAFGERAHIMHVSGVGVDATLGARQLPRWTLERLSHLGGCALMASCAELESA